MSHRPHIHIWLRAEQRANETRVGLTPAGAADLMAAGFQVSVEETPDRVIPTQSYAQAGCEIVPAHSWPEAPRDAIIFGLKELPDDGTALPHTHIMFGHAFKGQHSGARLLQRFRAGAGTLLDLEYLTDAQNRRVAAFGYWAGFAGAAIALKCWTAQGQGLPAGPIFPYDNAAALTAALSQDLLNRTKPSTLILGALGRVGTGAADLCKALEVPVTGWDMAETTHGGPFPEILTHQIFLNCILAGPNTPVFVPPSALDAPRALRIIGDIACDPDSDYNPVPIYSAATTWDAPAIRVHHTPALDVTAIDNLPSLLPLESSTDFAAQLLPHLLALKDDQNGVWKRASDTFQSQCYEKIR